MAPLCRFYQQGNCRNGANCRFEHPGANTDSNPFGANRFGALSNTSARPQDGANTYKVTKESIKVDLADERPTWILSCYGPGKEAPEQLFGGYPREQSLEEVMLHIRGSANPQQALAEVTALHNQAEHQIQTTLGNLDGAVQFILAGANNHPNRIDICKQNTREGGTNGVFAVKTGFADNPLTSNPGANQNPFSTTTQSNPFGGGGGGGGSGGGGTPAFGQPSTLGQKPSAFGTAPPSQFVQPSQMGAAAPAFGQPSQMGASALAFGQASQMGALAPTFGQPSNLGQRPNPFAGASTTAPSPFTQAGQPAFGQPSAIGQPANPFGAPAPSSANPFGQQPSAPPGASPFAQTPQPAASAASPFGQPAAPNPFTQPTAPPKDLSMDTSGPEPVPNNPFGQPPSTGPSFGAQISNSPFGAPTGGFARAPSGLSYQGYTDQKPPTTAAKPGPYAPGSAKQHPPVESYITKTMNGRITAFNGQPVVYKWKVNDRYQDQQPENPTPDQQTPGVRKPDGSWRKILFPDGPPPYNKDTEPDAGQYDANVKAAYAQMAAAGRFQGGMPEVPPMREDCVWLF
ncbi:hypothetical protein F4801DRAFT_444394 [Xylaria longipes]|nr:hypothetical protein F4801DRAFT_444394 [Xylaria longipes]RYC62768.1 hypothetical protein CHU98_g3458 [Xylaria longipes]